jgi:hypothetical protein
LGVAVQPAHWTVSLKSLTASSMSSGVFKWDFEGEALSDKVAK